jgi:uncharacterized protein (DUF1800 family)
MQAEIAVLRFALGARPGELAAAAGDPRAWLLAQVKDAAPLAVSAPLAASDQIFAELLADRVSRQSILGGAGFSGRALCVAKIGRRARP